MNITQIRNATILLEIGGHRILVDPMLSAPASLSGVQTRRGRSAQELAGCITTGRNIDVGTGYRRARDSRAPRPPGHAGYRVDQGSRSARLGKRRGRIQPEAEGP